MEPLHYTKGSLLEEGSVALVAEKVLCIFALWEKNFLFIERFFEEPKKYLSYEITVKILFWNLKV